MDSICRMSETTSFCGGWKLWVAQGFGVGRIPVAPGTFGSLVGLAWTAVLLAAGNGWIYLLGCSAGFVLSVWLCGEAERQLKQTDPGCIVLDEIAALPVCFAPWVIQQGYKSTGNFAMSDWATQWHGGLPLAGFLLFRLLDIWKPWPVRQSQRLPGGWGVTVDDFLAATYSAAGLVLLERMLPH